MYKLLCSSWFTSVMGGQLLQQRCECGSVSGPVWRQGWWRVLFVLAQMF
jgi:hypothetical protein